MLGFSKSAFHPCRGEPGMRCFSSGLNGPISHPQLVLKVENALSLTYGVVLDCIVLILSI